MGGMNRTGIAGRSLLNKNDWSDQCCQVVKFFSRVADNDLSKIFTLQEWKNLKNYTIENYNL